MLKDLVSQFAEIVKKHPELVMDNYELKEGLYIKLSLEKPFTSIEAQDYLVVRKEKNAEPSPETALSRWFKIRDFYSGLLNDSMNKAVDSSGKKNSQHKLFSHLCKERLFARSEREAFNRRSEKSSQNFL